MFSAPPNQSVKDELYRKCLYLHHLTGWLAFTKGHVLSQYLLHLEKRLGRGTDVDKLFLKCL